MSSYLRPDPDDAPTRDALSAKQFLAKIKNITLFSGILPDSLDFDLYLFLKIKSVLE